MNQTTMIAISTLTSSVNFYTRLIKMRNKTTGVPLFNIFQVELACSECIEKGLASQCAHRLHLIPRWQSSDRHTMLKTVMQDRPDLIESELAGLAFDAAQTVFRAKDLDVMFSQAAPLPLVNEDVHVFIDPAAGGPGSDYAILSVTRHKGLVTVSPARRIPKDRAERGLPDKRGLPEIRARRPRHGQHEAVTVTRFGQARRVRRALQARRPPRRVQRAFLVDVKLGDQRRVAHHEEGVGRVSHRAGQSEDA